MRQLESYSDDVSRIRSRALRNLVEKDERICAFTIEEDGVFIYTHSAEWDDGNGAGTFHGGSETEAVKKYKERVTKNTEGRS